MQQPAELTVQQDQVLNALQALYQAVNAEERKAANMFLVALTERAPSLSWELFWGLLAARQPEAQYLGAQLLIEKLQRTWDAVSSAERRAVGEFLLQEVLHGQRTPFVAKRLTRSLCIFCLYDQPDPVLATFDAIIASLSQRLTTGEPIAYIVDFLYALPVLAINTEFPSERRRRAISFVASRALTAINSLLVVLRAAAAANREDQGALVLQALTSWFSVEAAGAFLWSSFTTEGARSAVGEALQWLARPAILAKEGNEMVVELLDHPALPSYPRAFFRLLGSMVEIAQMYIRNGAIDPVPARALSVVFSEIGVDFASLILTASSQEDVETVARYFQVYGSLAANRNLDISSAAFAGWDEIFDAASRGPATPLHDTLVKPVCRALVELMFTQTRFNNGHSADDVQRFREDATYTILPACYALLGPEYTQLCWAMLQRAATTQPVRWEPVESAVYLLGAVSDQLQEDTDDILIKVALLYGQCPPEATQLRRTLLWFIVVYVDQVAKASDTSRALLVSLVNDAVNPANAELQRQTIEVIFSLCCTRPAAFTAATPGLLAIVDRVSPQNRSSFVDAIVALLPAHTPKEREQYMHQLAGPIIERVGAAANQVGTQSPPSAAAMAALTQEIGTSGALMQLETDANDPPFMFSIFGSLWPTLHRLLNAHPADESLSKAVCLWIQFSVSCLRRNLAPVLPEILNDLCVAFNALPSSSGLYALDRVIEICLQVRSAPLVPLQGLEMVINVFVQRISTVPINELLTDPTLALSLVFFAKNLIKVMPTLYCSADRTNFPPAGRTLFRLALTCISVNDAATGRFVLLYLTSLCTLQAENPAVVTIAGFFYGELLRALVQGTVSVPRQLLTPLGDTLFALNQLNPTAFAQHMQACLSEPGFPSDSMRTDSKLQWARSLSRAQKEQFKRLVHEFGNNIRAGHDIGRFASSAAPA